MPGGVVIPKQNVVPETGVSLAALGVEDPELGGTSRRAVAIATDCHRRPLADDVPAEADPRLPGKLQPEAGGVANDPGQAGLQPGWFDDRQEGARPAGEGRQPAQPLPSAGWPGPGSSGELGPRPPVRATIPAGRQVQHEEIHRPTGEQRPRDRQPFVRRLRGDDHQPVR